MEEPSYSHKVVTEVEEALYPDLGCDVIETLEKAINSFLKLMDIQTMIKTGLY